MSFASRAFHNLVWSRLIKVGLLFAVLSGCCSLANASPIEYSYTGVFSGSLGQTAFTDLQGMFTLTSADSDNVTGGYPFFNSGIASFQLTGFDAVSFTGATLGVESEYGAASFFDLASGFVVGEYNELTPLDILSTPGVSVSGDFVSYGAAPEDTSGGTLVITDGTNVRFSVYTPSVSPAVTPEPSSLWLVGTGLLGATAATRRRFVTR